MLDESLTLLRRLLEDDGPVTHEGPIYAVRDVELHAGTVQERIPVWIAGWWPHRRPLRRAARYEGVVPLWPEFALPTPAEYAECLAVIREAREEQALADTPFDALVWSRTDGPDDERPLAYPPGRRHLVGGGVPPPRRQPRRRTPTDRRGPARTG